MKKITSHSMVAEPKAPTEPSRVEKPPVARVVSAWQSASKRSMPASA
jgi:hypothetical protein